MADKKKIDAPTRPTHAVIRVNEGDDTGGGQPAPVYTRSSEGKFHIARGEAVPVPWGVVESLKHATKPKQVQRRDAEGKPYQTYIEIPRFGFTILAQISKDAYNKLTALAKKRPITEDEIYTAMETA